MTTRVLLALATMALGCTPATTSGPNELVGTSAAAETGTSDPIAAMYDGKARLSSAGIQRLTLGTQYTDTLNYNLPGDQDIQQNWVNGEDDLGLPDGSWTEVSVFTFHRTAADEGFLHVFTRGSGAAVQVRRRDTGSGRVVTLYQDGQPLDPGAYSGVDADYNILIAPGGSPSGTDSFSYDGLTFAYVDMDGNKL